MEPTSSNGEQFWCRMQVVFGSKKVAMTKVSRKPREHAMEITPFMIPALQTVDGEGVTKVVATWSGAPRGRFQTAAAK